MNKKREQAFSKLHKASNLVGDVIAENREQIRKEPFSGNSSILIAEVERLSIVRTLLQY